MAKKNQGKPKQSGSNESSGSGAGAPIRGGKMKASHICVEKLGLAQTIYAKIQAGKNSKISL